MKEVADKKIEELASRMILFKGRPWSWSEFNSLVTTVRSQLIEESATEKQLKKFSDLIAAAPIVGGSFNAWSGD